ncbi:MAG: anaerobic ribonucleoside-triphosphate reductase activating protein [Bacilli bacterium]|nr:anaerobic ribonucleoside-triphosphate reductase activating protein [Bacilli bacterium]
MMKIRLASTLQSDSIVDGEGIRTVVWTQGCSHNCPGCHNPGTHDFNGGFQTTTEEINKELSNLEGQTGITFSGGDPLFQVEACTEIAKHAKSIGLDVWCYTGFTYEELVKTNKNIEFLKYVDVLVDGKFIQAQRSLNVDFRGSKNQRIIDVPASLYKKEVVLIPKYIGERHVDVSIPKQKNIYI